MFYENLCCVKRNIIANHIFLAMPIVPDVSLCMFLFENAFNHNKQARDRPDHPKICIVLTRSVFVSRLQVVFLYLNCQNKVKNYCLTQGFSNFSIWRSPLSKQIFSRSWV